MTEYPESVIATSKKGKKEARLLIDRGTYVRYEYVDLETGKRSENKVRLVLIHKDKTLEGYFIIDTKSPRKLMLPTRDEPPRAIFDGKKVLKIPDDVLEP